jgi:hypothetical protein
MRMVVADFLRILPLMYSTHFKNVRAAHFLKGKNEAEQLNADDNQHIIM